MGTVTGTVWAPYGHRTGTCKYWLRRELGAPTHTLQFAHFADALNTDGIRNSEGNHQIGSCENDYVSRKLTVVGVGHHSASTQ